MPPIMPRPDYAGDVECSDVWNMLKAEPRAQLIDVRTRPEWTFVGLPEISALGRSVLCAEWQSYPDMAIDRDFVTSVAGQLAQAGADKNTALFFICRSGARSASAARAMTAAGFTRAYNVAGGFEGDMDDERHRGKRNGWKATGLPWRQS
ncbi:MAG TPA: rhodanese-like domain-containing protein [Rhizomicrobium sp.]|nr:rhodanese-like domain-containing protein [Rhizomicrobium sp.]